MQELLVKSLFAFARNIGSEMKQFSTARDIQRGSQSYMEKRRGRREIDMTRRRRGGVQKGRDKSSQ